MNREIEQILKNQVVIMGMLQDMQDELEPIQNIEDTHQLLVDKNNGWILVEEKMPPERDSIFAKLKGTDRWIKTMFEKTSDRVQVTVEDKNGKCITTTATTVDGQWHCDLLGMCKDYKITAWQPLSEPYREEQEDGR